MKPQRIQLSRKRGWRMPENTVKVSRPSLFGNPFSVDVYGRDGAVDRHKRWLVGPMSSLEASQSSRCDDYSDRGVTLTTLRRWVLDDVNTLRGKNLACWCALDQPCHADVLLELANAEPQAKEKPFA